jgi:hypothetical protein
MSHKLRPATVERPQQYRLLTMLGVVTLTAAIFALVRRMRPETQIGWAWVAAFAGVWIATTFGARALVRSTALRNLPWRYTTVISQVYFPVTLALWALLITFALGDVVPWPAVAFKLGMWIVAALGTAVVVATICDLLLGDTIEEGRICLIAGALIAFFFSLGTQIFFLEVTRSQPGAATFTTSLVYFPPLGMVFAARAVDYRNRCMRLIAQQEIERLLAEGFSPGR